MPETPPSPKPRTRWPLLGALAWMAVIAGAAQLVFAILWQDGLRPCSQLLLALHYLAFMAQVFAYHAGIAMVPIVLLAILSRRRRLLIAAAVVFIVGAGPELASLRPRLNRAAAPEGTLRIMSVNLMYGHGDVTALLAQIARQSPDVVVFQEWTEQGAKPLRAGLAAAYPHSLEAARDDAFGQAVFSRRPFVEPPRVYPPVGGFAEPQISVMVDVGGRPMRITDVHLLPPLNLGYFAEQRRGAAELAKWVSDPSSADKPDVLVGDFNATSRTEIVRVLLRAGMRDAQEAAGWGRGSTWPRVGSLVWAPGIQLDHALCGPNVEFARAQTGEDFGSDHRPVIVTVKWRSPGH